MVASVVGALVAVALYFIKQWRDVEALKVDSTNLQKKTSEIENNLNTITDRLIQAIDKNNKETELKIEKVRSEYTEKLASTEKEHSQVTRELMGKLEKINLAIVEMRAETNGNIEKMVQKVATHEDAIKEYQKGRIEFYQKFGGVLELLPKLIDSKRNV
ncbi:hypothetical protein [Rufibacter quisquiliarum]|uniref:Chromosome segregation ATPase n=1 Tax=Rufibacter quisquiliarum TaxID=1549639 RepID=A0A839GX94_9BACT|nr:hypothetical protein [Rufibacter quisquiliarum]MBA9078341.1 chromosome segregation ATPase [Rufibacter quisquiliarum]